jgi:hypothetical protein
MRCTHTLTEDSGTFIARATCATGAGSGVEAPAEREEVNKMNAPKMSARLCDKAHGREGKDRSLMRSMQPLSCARGLEFKTGRARRG